MWGDCCTCGGFFDCVACADCAYGVGDMPAPRGWAMRHGHRKRLATPKRGRAALCAEIQGQGREVFGGRSKFKRSVGKKNESRFIDRRSQKMNSQIRTMARRAFHSDVLEALSSFSDDYQLDDDDDEELGFFQLNDLASAPKVSERVESVRRLGPMEKEVLAISCALRRHNVCLDAETLKSRAPFPSLQRQFLKQHGPQLCRNLQQCVQRPVSLKPAALSAEVQARFLEACKGPQALEGTLRPAFHGTAVQRLQSIFERGLLIPGQENGVKVVNGSAHGLGIYTAQVDAPSLSLGFCRGGPMLVCGVLDDSTRLQQGAIIGRHQVLSESEHVRHVGNAMVVFDQRRVAPLFQASWTTTSAGRQLPTVLFNWDRHAALVLRVRGPSPPPASAAARPDTRSNRRRVGDILRARLRERRLAGAGAAVVDFLERRAAARRRR